MKTVTFVTGGRVSAFFFLALAAACGGEIADPNPQQYPVYGNGRGPAGSDAGSDEYGGGYGGDYDGGTPDPYPTPNEDASFLPPPPFLCTPKINDQNCAVSFNDDILQKMFGASGTLHCATAGCHDITGGINPFIDVKDLVGTYMNLYNAPTPIPYINPCSTDPNASAILGNLAFPATQGTHMPMDDTTGVLPSAADLATITTWVECGAPLN